jgi:hypothetical protein
VRGDYAAILGPSLDSRDTLRAWGSRYARLVLDRCGGNKREASRVLGISYHTLNGYLRFPAGAPTPAAAGTNVEAGADVDPLADAQVDPQVDQESEEDDAVVAGA